jgi:hypothetical protein
VKLDLRIPIGLLFGLLGLLLVVYGLASSPATYQVSLGINVNVWAGGGMLLFGGLMLGSAWLGSHSAVDGKSNGSA